MIRFNISASSLFIMLLIVFFGLAPRVQAKPNHVVIGYSGYWFDDLYPPEAYNYDALTHIARAFLVPSADGTIPIPPSYFDPALTQGARDHGVKLIASLGGGAAGSDNWFSIAKNPQYLEKFFNELGKTIQANEYDGVDIDWEPGAANKDQEQVFTSFMKALRARFPKWIITNAVGAGEDSAQFISWKELSTCVDYFNLMTYDYAGDWDKRSAFPANLFPSSEAKRNSGLCTDQAVSMLLNQYHVNPSQLLVGLPFYGVQFFSKELGDLFPTDGPKASSLEYYEIAPLLKKKGFKLQWDEDAQEPLLTKTKEESVVGFDNPQAISRKCQYVAEKNLPGIIIWNLGADVTGGKTPLMDAVATSFGAPKKSLPQKALTRIDSTFEDIVRGAWDSLSKLKERLANGGKNLEAKNANPGPALKPKTSLSGSRQQLAGYLEHLQNRLADLEQRTFEAKKAAAFLPLYEVAGKKPDVKGNSLLIEDFEENSNHCCGPEGWMVLADDYRLGTEVHPDPFKASPGGCPDSPGYAGHFWGHLGKGRAPNPLAELVCHFSGGQGGALTGWNLSDFTALQFWAKGDGGTYHLSLEQTCVQDGAYYGIDFTVENKWKKITLPFSQFRQSAGRPVPPHFIDARGLSFSLVNATGDVDFDLTVDQITLLK